jgi:hypothetical protein
MAINDAMDQDYKYFLEDEGFGPATRVRDVPPQAIERYRGKLPNQMLKYWQAYGWAAYGEGLFWTVNPDDYAAVVDAWLEGTPFGEDDDYYMIARGAFGKLYLWGVRSGQSILINAPLGMIFPTDSDRPRVAAGKGDFLARLFFSNRSKKQVDFEDDTQKPLFDRALKRLGPLAPDEMYGFVPALALGGPRRLDHLQKVKAVEHLLILAQLGERRIMADINKVIGEESRPSV